MVVERFGEPKEQGPSPLEFQLVLPIAKRFSREIGDICNKKFKGGAHMAVTVAAYILRNMLVNVTAQLYKNEREAGTAFISTVYDSAKKDAIQDWVEG